ncbi:MAG: hypothetical protein JWM64_2078 [Frankiales bacterium]|nr:hypothetical protein [Frankiales bacterium]
MVNTSEGDHDDDEDWSFGELLVLLDEDAEVAEVGPVLVRAVADLELLHTLAVRRARQRRESWPSIGAALGVTRQAAQKKYGYLDEML